MAADPASAAAVLAQVNAASDDMADLGLEDMQDPVDDDEEYIDETSGKKKQRSWLGKIGKGISKRVNKATAVITGGVMTAEDNEALARVNACRHPFALKEGGIGIQDPNEAKLCRSVLSMIVQSMPAAEIWSRLPSRIAPPRPALPSSSVRLRRVTRPA